MEERFEEFLTERKYLKNAPQDSSLLQMRISHSQGDWISGEKVLPALSEAGVTRLLGFKPGGP